MSADSLSRPSVVTEEMITLFRAALRPAYIAWHDGRELSREESREQIRRGLMAALGEDIRDAP